MNKILHIDTDLQIPNRILKDDTNKVKQITDKAQGIAFTQSDEAKMPIYNYGGYYEFDGVNDEVYGGKNVSLIQNDNYTFAIKFNQAISGAQVIFNKWIEGGGSGASEFMLYLASNIARWYQAGEAGSSGIRRTVEYAFNSNEDVTIYVIQQKIASNEYKLALIIKDETNPTFKVGQITTLVDAPPTTDTPIRFGKGNFGTSFNGVVYGVYFENSNLIDISSIQNLDEVSIPDFNAFNYYHRYKDDGNKKLHLSSKYLKDAVINESNEITSLNNSFNNYTVKLKSDDAQNTTITKSGIKFTNTLSPIVNASNLGYDTEQVEQYHIRQSDFFIGGWYMKEEVGSTSATFFAQRNDNYINFASYPSYPNETNVTFIFANNIHTFPFNYGLNKYRYIAILRRDSQVSFLIDGILISTFFDDTSLGVNGASTQIRIGTQQNQSSGISYVDSVLFAKDDSLINPTGYSIGAKVFEPPRRGAFNDKVEYDGREFYKAAGDNAVLFLNARYLEGSVIDSSGQITSINDELNNVGNYTGGKAILTTNGIKIDSLCGGINFGNIPQTLSNLDFFMGCWAKIETSGGPFPNALIAKLNPNGVYTFSFDYLGSIGAVRFVYSTDGSTNSSITFPHTLDSNHHYFFVFRFNNTLYMGIDGTIKSINNFNVTLFDSALNSLYVGSIHGISSFNLRGHIDDVFFSVGNSIIDPTVFSVGDKVFTPPRRSSSQLVLIK